MISMMKMTKQTITKLLFAGTHTSSISWSPKEPLRNHVKQRLLSWMVKMRWWKRQLWMWKKETAVVYLCLSSSSSREGRISGSSNFIAWYHSFPKPTLLLSLGSDELCVNVEAVFVSSCISCSFARLSMLCSSRFECKRTILSLVEWRPTRFSIERPTILFTIKV